MAGGLTRRAAQVAVGASLAALLGGPSAAGAQGGDRGTVRRGPDRPAVTPVPNAGSADASSKAIDRRTLRKGLATQMKRAGGAGGAAVVDLDRRRHPTLFGWALHTRRILASNTKLFTTAALLERYGGGRRFRTDLWARGHRRGRGDRILGGGLALVGAGDPTLADDSFAREHGLPGTGLRPLADAVRKAGIRVVDGNIAADPTVFDARSTVHQTGITGGPFLGSLSGLDYDAGLLGGSPAPSPAKLAGKALKRKLQAAGVHVRGEVRVGRVPARVRRQRALAAVSSPSVAQLVAATLKPSNDFYAEMLLKRLAAAGGHKGTTARGVRVVERFARRAGSFLHTENGSGLSRLDVSSPRNVVQLLASMSHRSDFHSYRSALPLACSEGTVAQRMCGTAAAGHCRTKTGTLADVSALSGYCEAGGHLVAFSILMNAVTSIGAAQRHQDKMAALIARYRP